MQGILVEKYITEKKRATLLPQNGIMHLYFSFYQFFFFFFIVKRPYYILWYVATVVARHPVCHLNKVDKTDNISVLLCW